MRIMKEHCGRRRDVVRAKHQNLTKNRLLGRLRASWERPLLGPILASKTIAKCSKLGQDGAKMAPSWAKMEPKWRQVGLQDGSWGALGRSLRFWHAQGRLGEGFGTPKDRFGRPKPSQDRPQIHQKSNKNRCFFFDTFSPCILKRFWRILAPCWLQFQRFLGTQSGFKPHRPIF